MATDEGFFGPSSVSWRIHRDASAILGAGRALLVQAQIAPPLCVRCGLKLERSELGESICHCSH